MDNIREQLQEKINVLNIVDKNSNNNFKWSYKKFGDYWIIADVCRDKYKKVRASYIIILNNKLKTITEYDMSDSLQIGYITRNNIIIDQCNKDKNTIIVFNKELQKTFYKQVDKKEGHIQTCYKTVNNKIVIVITYNDYKENTLYIYDINGNILGEYGECKCLK